MASTVLSVIVERARRRLNLNTAGDYIWTDRELVEHANNGIRQLWRSVKNLKRQHFFTQDITNVSYETSSTSLTGVPSDVDVVHMIRPRSLTTFPGTMFVPRDIGSSDWERALQLSAQDPISSWFYYAITGAGGPVGAPTILVVPTTSTAIPLEFVYLPTLGTYAITDTHPIPGESDDAIEYYIVAHALAKTRQDRDPSPAYLQLYEKDKDELLVSLTDRQDQEPRYVDAVFQDDWN
jgi:hypothetical protein